MLGWFRAVERPARKEKAEGMFGIPKACTAKGIIAAAANFSHHLSYKALPECKAVSTSNWILFDI